MSIRRIKICVLRVLCMLSIPVGMVSAWNVGPLILNNALHGWQQIPQLAAALFVSWVSVRAAGWMWKI